MIYKTRSNAKLTGNLRQLMNQDISPLRPQIHTHVSHKNYHSCEFYSMNNLFIMRGLFPLRSNIAFLFGKLVHKNVKARNSKGRVKGF